jgi:hypothetical protein
MSDLAKQHIKHEPIPFQPTFNFPPHFDPKLFPLPSFSPFAPHPPSASFPGSYDHSLMLASRLYGSQYPRDFPMAPPPRPPSRSLQHAFSLRENHPDPSISMEKMFEKYYPGVLPSYLAAAASAAAAASTNSNSPGSSLNVKMHGAPSNGPDHPLWSHREALQRQFLAASNQVQQNHHYLIQMQNYHQIIQDHLQLIIIIVVIVHQHQILKYQMQQHQQVIHSI